MGEYAYSGGVLKLHNSEGEITLQLREDGALHDALHRYAAFTKDAQEVQGNWVLLSAEIAEGVPYRPRKGKTYSKAKASCLPCAPTIYPVCFPIGFWVYYDESKSDFINPLLGYMEVI